MYGRCFQLDIKDLLRGFQSVQADPRPALTFLPFLQDYGTAADVFSYGVVLWDLLTLEQPWFNDHERPGLCSRIMPEVHGGNQLFVIRQVPLGVRLPLPSAQDVEPPLPDLPQVRPNI